MMQASLVITNIAGQSISENGQGGFLHAEVYRFKNTIFLHPKATLSKFSKN